MEAVADSVAEAEAESVAVADPVADGQQLTDLGNEGINMSSATFR